MRIIQLVVVAGTHNVWLKDYPHLLIPLMLIVGTAMIAIGIIGLRSHFVRRKSSQRTLKIPVLLFASVVGTFLIAFALWIFAAVYFRA